MLVDLVTVCFSGELNLLRLQARSLDRFMPEAMIGRIVLIPNDVDEAACVNGLSALVPEFGRHASKVQIVRPSELMTTKATGLDRWRRLTKQSNRYPFRNEHGGWRGLPGWKTQQVLKLVAVRACVSQFVLILDAKNHFLQPVAPRDFVAPDGRPRSRKVKVATDEHRGWVDAAFRVLGLPPPPVENPIPPTTTPFFLPRDDLAFALKAIESRIGALDVQFFRSRWRATEFCLIYAAIDGFLEPWWDRFDEGLVVSRTIFRATTTDELERKLGAAERGDARMLGLHRAQLAVMPPDPMRRLREVWRRAGLLEPDETWI